MTGLTSQVIMRFGSITSILLQKIKHVDSSEGKIATQILWSASIKGMSIVRLG